MTAAGICRAETDFLQSKSSHPALCTWKHDRGIYSWILNFLIYQIFPLFTPTADLFTIPFALFIYDFIGWCRADRLRMVSICRLIFSRSSFPFSFSVPRSICISIIRNALLMLNQLSISFGYRAPVRRALKGRRSKVIPRNRRNLKCSRVRLNVWWEQIHRFAFEGDDNDWYAR